MSAEFLDQLEEIIKSRASDSADSSYTASLLHKGPHKCAKKFGEEAVEFVLAIASEEQQNVTNEAADVIYHLMVALAARGVRIDDVIAELKSRTRQSGLQEKASRAK